MNSLSNNTSLCMLFVKIFLQLNMLFSHFLLFRCRLSKKPAKFVALHKSWFEVGHVLPRHSTTALVCSFTHASIFHCWAFNFPCTQEESFSCSFVYYGLISCFSFMLWKHYLCKLMIKKEVSWVFWERLKFALGFGFLLHRII